MRRSSRALALGLQYVCTQAHKPLHPYKTPEGTYPVDIVCEDRRDRDELRRSGRRDRHVRDNKHRNRARAASQRDGSSRSNEACALLVRAEGQRVCREDGVRLQGARAKAHRRAEGEWDAEPRDAAEQVGLGCAAGVGRDRTLPVGLVQEDGRRAEDDGDAGV